RDRQDRVNKKVRDRHQPNSSHVESEPAVPAHQLPGISWKPLHDPEKDRAIAFSTISTARIQQRRTTPRTTRSVRREKPLHDTHTGRGRSINRGRRLNKPLQSNTHTRRTSRTTSKIIPHSHTQRNKE